MVAGAPAGTRRRAAPPEDGHYRLGDDPAVQAVRRADPAIPIVMTNMSDPIGSGLAESLSHPGGNITGLTMLSTDRPQSISRY